MKQELLSEVECKEKLSLNERLAVSALQKLLQVLKLKEVLILGSFIIGSALLRVPMQALPSVEPITFFAILSGWLFGKKKGLFAGASAFYISNFFCVGGQGPWSIFQVIGAGAAGLFGGFLRKEAKIWEVLLVALSASLIFEISVNIGSLTFFPYSIFVLFLSALPFTLVHTISNLIFATGLPFAKRFVEKKGGFDEREIAIETLKQLKSKVSKQEIGEKLNGQIG